MKYDINLEKLNAIVKRFDEVVTEKANKQEMRELEDCMKLYIKTTEFME